MVMGWNDKKKTKPMRIQLKFKQRNFMPLKNVECSYKCNIIHLLTYK